MRPRRFKVFGEGSSKQPGQYEGRATSLHGARRIQKQAAVESGRRPDVEGEAGIVRARRSCPSSILQD